MQIFVVRCDVAELRNFEQIGRALHSFVLAEGVALKIYGNYREVNCSNQDWM